MTWTAAAAEAKIEAGAARVGVMEDVGTPVPETGKGNCRNMVSIATKGAAAMGRRDC